MYSDNPQRLRALSCALCVVVLLTGCLGDFLRETTPLRCPPTQVVEQASAYTQFVIANDVDTAQYTLRFDGLTGDCRLDGDGSLEMNLFMRFLAIPGAALKSKQIAEASWFLVLLQDQGQDQLPRVLSRQVFAQQIPLQRGANRQFFQEQYTINVTGIGERDMQNLVLIGGYVIDDAQWNFHEQNPFFFQ